MRLGLILCYLPGHLIALDHITCYAGGADYFVPFFGGGEYWEALDVALEGVPIAVDLGWWLGGWE